MPAPEKATLSTVDRSKKGRSHLQILQNYGRIRKTPVSREPLSSTTNQIRKSLRLLYEPSKNSNIPGPTEPVSPAMDRSELSTEQLQTLNQGRSLFDLPPELRNMVYKEVFTSTPRIETKWMDMPVTLHLSGKSEDDSMASHGIPTCFLTCRQIFYEARAVLQANFDLEIGPYFPTGAVIDKDPSLQVVTPSAKASLTLRILRLDARVDTRGPRYSPTTIGLATLKHVSMCLNLERVPIGRQLRHLCLQADFVNVCPICQPHARLRYLNTNQHCPWRLDLSFLEVYGLNLNRFELQVGDVDTFVANDGYIHHANHWSQVESCFQEEMRRVGSSLTGNFHGDLKKKETKGRNRKTLLYRYDRQLSRHTSAYKASQHEWATKATTSGELTNLPDEEGFISILL